MRIMQILRLPVFVPALSLLAFVVNGSGVSADTPSDGARVLIEQSIGRGLRLPYGERTGVTAVDRLNIVAHDRFQEIVDEANKSDSIVRMQQVVLTPEDLVRKPVTVVVPPVLDLVLGLATPDYPVTPGAALSNPAAVITNPEESR